MGRTPPLRETHADRGASFTEFGGWEMPVEFDSISEEHHAVREEAGIFDVSHMGEIEVAGPDATTLCNRLTTNDVSDLEPGEAQYTAITTDEGILIDDTVVYRLPDDRADRVRHDGKGPIYLFVPNAGNDADAYDRWQAERDRGDLNATVYNATEDWAMFAVQGPDAPGAADRATDAALDALGRFEATYGEIAGVECWIARTGYTGEDGFEILCPWDEASSVWEAFESVQPCGLGSRDTLRIEQGFLLSGQDFHPDDEPRTPYEAGIGFAVDLSTEFVGRDALAERTEPAETFTGLELLERGIARHGYEITYDGDVVGVVTSGTKVPTQQLPVALGYLPAELAEPGTEVGVRIRGETKRARVTTPPFEQDQ